MVSLIILLQAYEKVLIVIALAIILIYTLVVSFVLVTCKNYKLSLKNHKKALKIIIFEKLIIQNKIYKLKNGEELYNALTFENVGDKLGDEHIVISYIALNKGILSLIQSLKERSDIKEQLDNLSKENDENDTNYKRILEKYSSELLAYNYWCRFILVRPFTKMFKYNKLNSIN